jgi:hypothetical protein
MNEAEWVELVAQRVKRPLRASVIRVETGFRVPYGYEISAYDREEPESTVVRYETDLVLLEDLHDDRWKPRVVVEAKIGSISTHDAITYSHKAATHKAVHPYLRYGIMLGNRRKYPLPGRLFRHGTHFDFMISFKTFEPTRSEMRRFLEVLRSEIEASQTLEKILYDSRRKDRDRYTVLHRKLELR